VAEVTLFRTIVILAGGLVLMLSVVILRAETARLHYEISRYERRADECSQQLREAELELARLRNPMMIRKKVKDAVEQLTEEKSKPAKDPSKKRGRP